MNKLRLISLLCTIAMLIGCFAMFPAFAAEAEAEVETPTTVNAEGNGSGTAEDPYLIYVSNFADYYTNYSTKSYYAQHVKLMEDITVNEGDATEWAVGTNRPTTNGVFGLWTGPMGGGTVAMTGSFDGNGHTISGVCLIGEAKGNSPDGPWRRIGLFAGVSGTLKNLKLTNSYFEMNCTGNDTEVASFAPRLAGTIENCYSDAILVQNNMTSNATAGGIAGRAHNGTNAYITNCVFAGSITSKNVDGGAGARVGGILGNTSSITTYITNCLFIGKIDAAIYVGGILGNVGAATTVEGCMSIIKDGALKTTGGTVSDFYAGGINNGNVTVNSMYVVAGFRSTNSYVAAGKGISSVSGTWANIKQVTLNDINTSAVVAEGGKLAGWNYNSDSYVPNPTTLKGTDIAWTNFATKWVAGRGNAADANALFTLDQSNFNDFYNSSQSMTEIYGYYFMTSDVTVNDGNATDWANGSRPSNVWNYAIGKNSNGICGGFDGQDHEISGVCLIGNEDTRRTSLFAGINSNATLRNVKLVNSYFEGHASGSYEEVAAFASRLGGTIRNCYTDAILVNNGAGGGECATGGIAGRTHNANLDAVTEAKIENCAFAGSVTTNGAMSTGGILGFAGIKTTITNCTNAGTVASNSSESAARPGGMIGYNNNANTTINNCLNVGSITHVGGLSGGMLGQIGQTTVINHSMNLSTTGTKNAVFAGGQNVVTSTLVKINDFVAVRDYAVKNLDSMNTTYATAYEAGKLVYIDSIKDLFDADIVAKGAVLEGWSFKEGFIAEPSGLLELTYADILGAKYWTVSDAGGTSGKWYSLDNDNFQQFWETNKGNNNYSFSGNFVLIDDITVNTGKSSDWATNREGVTVFTTIKSLNGTFDGNGHTISGLCVYNATNDSANRFMGIFAVVAGTVRDLTIENSYFYSNNTQGHNGVGAIAGRLSGSIINCHVASDVTVSHKNDEATAGGNVGIGGLAGDARNGAPKVIDSTFAGVVKSNSAKTGGIVGITSTATTITNCVNSGSVTSDGNAVGGIVGATFEATVAISNCVNTGTVTSNKDDNNAAHVRPGGIFGYSGVKGSTITNCLNTGAVIHTAGNTLSGGIVGNVGNNAASGDSLVIYTVTVENCLSLGSVQSGNLYAGGHTGAVVVTSFYRVKGLGINNYASGASFTTVTDATNGQWKNIKEISFAEFLNGTYLAGWVREDGLLPSPTANAKIDLINYVNKNTLGLDSTGAVHSIRISPTEPGLRFETKVDAAALAALEELGYTVEMKTYITLAAYASSVDFTAATLYDNKMPYLTVGATKYLRTEAEDGYTAFAGSVVNVKDLTRFYAGIGCITLTKDGQRYDIYAKYNKDENASVSGVAFIAARDTKAASETGYTNQIVDIYGNTVYSPYDANQYKAITILMGATPETAILNYGLNGNDSYTASMSNVSVNAVSADEATDVYSDWTKWAAQGGCIVDGYIYTVMWSNNVDGKTNPNKCVIVKTNLSDGKVVAKSAALDLGHGNDLTFNGTDLVAVSCDPAKKVFFINPATLALDESRTKTLTVTPVSIDYDTVNNKYVVVDAQNTYVYIYDADFNLERTISGAGMTKGTAGTAIPDGSYSMQGIMTDGSYVYILGWHGGDTWAEEGSLSSLEHFFTSGIKSSIRVVDLASGAFVQDIDLGIEREVEFVDYENGTFYIGCNNSMWTGMEFYAGTIS